MILHHIIQNTVQIKQSLVIVLSQTWNHFGYQWSRGSYISVLCCI